jgi:hypothetical protein
MIRLDMSQFHGLDHRILSTRCRRQHRGAIGHLEVWWILGRHGRDFWLKPWWRLRCWAGWDHTDEIWQGPDYAIANCKGCNRRRTVSEHELESLPRFSDIIITHEEKDMDND